MMVNYATSTLPFEMHTGNNVPLYASGPGAEHLPAYLTQADIYTLVRKFLALPPATTPGNGR
jgi:alkaline phosphatase